MTMLNFIQGYVDKIPPKKTESKAEPIYEALRKANGKIIKFSPSLADIHPQQLRHWIRRHKKSGKLAQRGDEWFFIK